MDDEDVGTADIFVYAYENLAVREAAKRDAAELYSEVPGYFLS